jgi:hypothetical protein
MPIKVAILKGMNNYLFFQILPLVSWQEFYVVINS